MAEEGFFLTLGLWPNVDIDMGLLVFYPPQQGFKTGIYFQSFLDLFIDFVYVIFIALLIKYKCDKNKLFSCL